MNTLSDNGPDAYQDLLDEISQEIVKTRSELQKQKEICYWKIGRHIAKHLLNNKGKSGYRERLYPRLTHDLKIDERTLRQIEAVYRSLQKPGARTQLKVDIKA